MRVCEAKTPEPLGVRARRALLEDALLVSVLAVFAGALVLLVFDWPVREALLGTAAGAFLWGCSYFFLEVRHYVLGEAARTAARTRTAPRRHRR
jgi:hypothetical protein